MTRAIAAAIVALALLLVETGSVGAETPPRGGDWFQVLAEDPPRSGATTAVSPTVSPSPSGTTLAPTTTATPRGPSGFPSTGGPLGIDGTTFWVLAAAGALVVVGVVPPPWQRAGARARACRGS